MHRLGHIPHRSPGFSIQTRVELVIGGLRRQRHSESHFGARVSICELLVPPLDPLPVLAMVSHYLIDASFFSRFLSVDLSHLSVQLFCLFKQMLFLLLLVFLCDLALKEAFLSERFFD
jgi:hypothetical protein